MQQAESNIFLVDDDAAVRDSLCEFFNAEGIRALAFDSAEAFLAIAPETKRGCVIVDIHMPGLTGLELQRELVRRGASIPVIVITGQGDVPKAVAALKAGAADFIEKPFDPAHLLKIAQDTLSQYGHRYEKTKDIETRIAQLTPREREVMDLVVEGHPNKVIAAKLGISIRTVENHRAHMMEKTECPSLSALIALGLQMKK